MSDSTHVTRSYLPWVVLSLGICAVSSGAIFAKMADAPGLVTAAWRVGLAAVFLLPLVIWKGRKEIAALSRAQIGLSILSGFFLAIHFATWITSLQDPVRKGRARIDQSAIA